jgi:phosphoribosylamine-glycine ligase
LQAIGQVVRQWHASIHNEVVWVSMTTGRALSVVYPGGSCSQGSSQIYDAADAVWEPTSQQILRIDPAGMPG